LPQTGATGAISWGVECKLWKIMAKNGDRPQKVSELAEQADVDPLMLGEWTWRARSKPTADASSRVS
jgi:hypothetical protein